MHKQELLQPISPLIEHPLCVNKGPGLILEGIIVPYSEVEVLWRP